MRIGALREEGPYFKGDPPMPDIASLRAEIQKEKTRIASKILDMSPQDWPLLAQVAGDLLILATKMQKLWDKENARSM